MRQLIEKKRNEYAALQPTDPRVQKWIRDSDLWCWLYSLMRLIGRPLSAHQIMSILAGELDENLPLSIYEFLHNCAAVYKDMEGCVFMQASPDVKLLSRWFSMAMGHEAAFRKNNPIIYQWNYIAPAASDVPALTAGLLRQYASSKSGEDPLEKGCVLMNGLLRIYPYGEDTIIAAGLLLVYELLRAGIPLPTLSTGEQEFNDIVARCISQKSDLPMLEMLQRCVVNRLETVVQVCRQAAEQ